MAEKIKDLYQQTDIHNLAHKVLMDKISLESAIKRFETETGNPDKIGMYAFRGALLDNIDDMGGEIDEETFMRLKPVIDLTPQLPVVLAEEFLNGCLEKQTEQAGLVWEGAKQDLPKEDFLQFKENIYFCLEALSSIGSETVLSLTEQVRDILESVKEPSNEMSFESSDKGARVFVDMDGVLAKWNEFLEYSHLPKEEYLSRVDEEINKEGYYRRLPPNEKMVAAVKELIKDGVDVHILTASLNNETTKDKLRWLTEYLPEIDRSKVHVVPYGRNKADYVPEGIRKTDYLFDDYSKNLHKWEECGGTGVKVFNGINGNFGTWQKNAVSLAKNDLSKTMKDIALHDKKNYEKRYSSKALYLSVDKELNPVSVIANNRHEARKMFQARGIKNPLLIKYKKADKEKEKRKKSIKQEKVR